MKPQIDVKEAILATAKDLFIKNGYNGTSIRDIAAASDTNVAMVNYYFGSKYELFEIVFEEAFDVLMNRIFTIVDSDMPFYEMLDYWVSIYYDILLENPQIPIFILNEVNTNPDKLSKRLREKNPYNILVRMTARINDEVEKGTIKKTDPIDLLLNIMSLCVFPFISKSLLYRVAEVTPDDFQTILKAHKTNVIKFITDSIRPADAEIENGYNIEKKELTNANRI